ncbi:hypothetical protein LCGC14_0542310 [marine sediment metagenome]|uniref:Uncharacterized protein n=1 Tax=marine sediment metagenome TaxID=412755 RepID=A0A0F9UDS8_9ZZZZ
MEHDRIAEALADIRSTESTHPELGQERNTMLDDVIVALRNSLDLHGIEGQLFCARAQYGRTCKHLRG